jgi:predicted TIM-barrel fold metal-dependent hydrolase
LRGAVAEMEHCAAMGLRGVVLGVFPSGRGYPTPQDDRFWSAALDLDMPVAVHVQLDRTGPRSGPLVNYPRQDPQLVERIGPRREFARKLTDFAYGGAENAIQMVLDGVFDRFPKLKIFFAENQIGWIPVFNYSADFRYRRHRFWAEDLMGLKPLARPPSEYIREHCYWGFQYDRVGIELRDRIGVDRVIWATDFPHQDCEYPHSPQAIERDFAGVPEQEKYQMVCGNVIDFFHLDAARSASAASHRATQA